MAGFSQYQKKKDSGVEWIGSIPSHWDFVRISHKASVKARLGWKGLKADEYVDDGYAFLATPNLKGGTIDFDNVNYITTERYLESPEIILRDGDVLLTKDGSLGISNVVRKLPKPSTVNSSIAVIRPSEMIDSVFLHYFFCSSYFQNLVFRMKDGMGVPHLFQADIRKFSILVPPLQEQRGIADFLDAKTSTIDAVIRKKEQLIELLQEKRQAAITRAVTKGLDPMVPMKDSGIKWLGEIPEHWEVKRLKHLSPKLSGRLIVQPHQYFADDGVPILFANNVRHGRIVGAPKRISFNADARFAHCRLRKGDLVTVRVGDPGETAVVPPELDGCHYASIMMVRKSSKFVSSCTSYAA